MCVRFFNPKDYEAQNIVLQIAQEKGIKIDKYSISHLLNIHNGDVALAANELDKFRVYDREITTKDIKKECRKRLPQYMVPDEIFFMEQLPKTSSGKTNKIEIVKTINEMQSQGDVVA